MAKKKVVKKAKPPAREPATPKSVQPRTWRRCASWPATPYWHWRPET